jgi:hypothetical protein
VVVGEGLEKLVVEAGSSLAVVEPLEVVEAGSSWVDFPSCCLSHI